jgi:Acetyltransferase (GNAT) domain
VAVILAKSEDIGTSVIGVQGVILRGPTAVSSSDFVAQWDALAKLATEPNPFYESWFLLPALKSFDPGSRVGIFTLWSGMPHHSVLLGIMPLADGNLYGRWPIAHKSNWLHHNAFLGTPLVAAGFEDSFWHQLLSVLDEQSGKALFMHVNGLVIDGLLQSSLAKICQREQRSFAIVAQQERAFLQSDQSLEQYFATTVRAKKRKELRRQRNRLSELGNLEFARHAGSDGLAQWTDEFLTLEQRGWKGSNGSALNCAQETRSMFGAALHGAAAQGRLERLDLRLNGAPLAMLVNFICPPGSFAFKTAFDEEYARFSPGVLLQLENLMLLERADVEWCDSCAAEGHPMIDSLWRDRRHVGRYSFAIGGYARRAVFGLLLQAETARHRARTPAISLETQAGQNL